MAAHIQIDEPVLAVNGAQRARRETLVIVGPSLRALLQYALHGRLDAVAVPRLAEAFRYGPVDHEIDRHAPRLAFRVRQSDLVLGLKDHARMRLVAGAVLQ